MKSSNKYGKDDKASGRKVPRVELKRVWRHLFAIIFVIISRFTLIYNDDTFWNLIH